MAATGAMLLMSAGGAIFQNQKSQAAKGMQPKPGDIPDPSVGAPSALDQAVSTDVKGKMAGDRQRQKAQAAFGRSSTLLTGPSGPKTAAPVVRATLLGV